MEKVKVHDYSFAYDYNLESSILKNIHFSLEKGTITLLIGLSGSGKTTLCRSLCGIIPNIIKGKTEGEILINGEGILGKNVSDLAREIGFIMQDPDDQMVCTTIEDELAFAPENMALPPDEIRDRVERVLTLLELQEIRLKNPNQLSGGQKQLVAIGGILTLNADIILLDEPMSHLDDRGKDLVKNTLSTLRKQGKTILMVEHDLKSLSFVDQCLILSNGRIEFDGSPKEAEKEIEHVFKG